MVRTPCCDKSGLRKGTWTPEEDRKLKAYVTKYGYWNWRQLPKYAGKTYRVKNWKRQTSLTIMTDLVNLLLTNRLVGYLLSITFAFRRTILFFLASYVNLVWGFFSLMIKYIAAKFHKRMMIQMVITSLFNLAFLFNIIDYIYISVLLFQVWQGVGRVAGCDGWII